MTRIRLHPRQFTLVYILALAIVSLPLAHSDTWAQGSGSNRPNPTPSPKPNTTPPQKTQPRRAIGRMRGLGTRDRCHHVDKPLTAIVAPIPTEAELTEAKTTETLPPATIAERPTLWFYVPYSPDSRLEAKFTLIDDKNENLYQTKFPLKEKPGIIGLKLPETLPPLQAGKRYQWVLSVICSSGPGNESADISVDGYIERIPLDSTLQAQLKKMSDPKAQSALYAEKELWSEALTTLAQARRGNLKDPTLQVDWSNLLKSMNLDDIASEPLTRCCTTEKPK